MTPLAGFFWAGMGKNKPGHFFMIIRGNISPLKFISLYFFRQIHKPPFLSPPFPLFNDPEEKAVLGFLLVLVITNTAEKTTTTTHYLHTHTNSKTTQRKHVPLFDYPHVHTTTGGWRQQLVVLASNEEDAATRRKIIW